MRRKPNKVPRRFHVVHWHSSNSRHVKWKHVTLFHTVADTKRIMRGIQKIGMNIRFADEDLIPLDLYGRLRLQAVDHRGAKLRVPERTGGAAGNASPVAPLPCGAGP